MVYAEANEAIEGFCRRERCAYLPVLTPLLWHEHPQVFRSVIGHFVEIDCDDGALDVIAQHLLEPGIRNAKDFGFQSPTAHDLCEYLDQWANPAKAELHRRRAAQIARQAIVESLDSDNPAERLAIVRNSWLSAGALIRAICQFPVDGAAGVLERVALNSNLEPRLRAEALLRYKALTGITLAARKQLISEFFALDSGPVEITGNFIGSLVAHDLVTMEELAHGAANPKWTGGVVEAISQWLSRDKIENVATVAVRGLRVALATLSQKLSSDTEEIRYVVECLRALPRTPDDDAGIRQSLQSALASAGHMADRPWVAKEVMTMLLAFNGGAALDLDTMNPWDAMQEHWRRENIYWQSALQLLVEAGAISPERRLVLPQRISETTMADIHDQLESVLRSGGRGCHKWLNSTSYEHRHDELFSSFVSLAHQPMVLDSVVQSGGMEISITADDAQPREAKDYGIPVLSTEGTRMQVVASFQGKSFKFYAHPNGTYTDAWAVLHAFNQFMAQLGRSERAFWLGSEQEGEDEGLFVCALPDKFLAACEKLRIPLRDSNAARRKPFDDEQTN
ncbi:hypothetical protein AACH06_28445 [Ideonella sp. DXS29W]|uniref:Zorya protein ZorC EH domain-containing protein n=1 Tax=Ideonella lacteola TaxID=2984193 RepID=A0ABU9BXR3_9BURK